MSIRWMTRVWDEAVGLDGTALLVLLCIADHAQDDGARAWPSVARLAQRSRRSERTVREVLTELEAAGWLRREFRPGRSTIYHLLDPATPAVDRSPAESAPLRPTAGVETPTPAVDRTPPLRPTAGRTIKEPPTTTAAATTTEVTGSSDDEPVSRTRDTDEIYLPMVLQRKLRDVGQTDGVAWTAAWRSAVTLQWPEFAADEADRFPEEHLMLHLMAQQEQGRVPSPSRWMRFYIEDRNRRIGIIAGQLEQIERMNETPQEREDRLNRRLPPADWGVPPQEPTETGTGA